MKTRVKCRNEEIIVEWDNLPYLFDKLMLEHRKSRKSPNMVFSKMSSEAVWFYCSRHYKIKNYPKKRLKSFSDILQPSTIFSFKIYCEKEPYIFIIEQNNYTRQRKNWKKVTEKKIDLVLRDHGWKRP